MNLKNNTRHMIDILFVLGLFAVFALSALLLVTFGSKIYQNTVNKMDQNYTMRMAYSYLTEKVRQSDTKDCVQIGELQGNPAVIITSEINQEFYETYLYHHDGFLKELFIKKGTPIDATAGNSILAVQSFEAKEIKPSLLSFSVTDSSQHNVNFLVDLKSHTTTEK